MKTITAVLPAILVLATLSGVQAQPQPTLCIKIIEATSCQGMFGNPQATAYCSAGQQCTAGQCPGEQEEYRNLSNWNGVVDRAREALMGETGDEGQLGLWICRAKRDCICQWDEYNHYYVCVLGGDSTQVNLQTFTPGTITGPPCEGGSAN